MPFLPNKKSLKQHKTPEWYNKAKLGIMITWGLYSIPAYAPIGEGSSSEMIVDEGWEYYFKNTPYAEWYINSIKIKGSPAQKYHHEHYNDAAYEDFAPQFNESIKQWNPESWANLFQKIGVRYIVLITKHMDGFVLWPSEHPNPKKENYFAKRDIVSELTDAVRSKGIRMGIYYSGVMDDTWNSSTIQDFGNFVTYVPLEREYSEYVDNHYYEIIDKWKPDILWNDIGYPPYGKLYEIIAHYYNTVKDGAINDRWSIFSNIMVSSMKYGPIRKMASWFAKRAFKKGGAGLPGNVVFDFQTPEYAVFDKIKRVKWECVRGIGRSFGYNKMESEEHHLSVTELIHLLVDVVSKNGNLLLDIGPKADGSIPEIQLQRLLGLGKWLEINGEAIFDTRPWIRAEGITSSGIPVRFTQKDDELYAIILGEPKENEVIIKDLDLNQGINIYLLGNEEALPHKINNKDLKIVLPKNFKFSSAICFKILSKPK